MKNLLKLTLVFLLILSSCSKDNNEPFTPVANNAASQTLISNLETYARTATTTNYEANLVPSSEDCFFYVVYPITVITNDGGDIINVEIHEDFLALLESCGLVSSFQYQNCFMVDFPVDILDENGNQTTIADVNDLIAIAEIGIAGFVYPITVTSLSDQTTITVNSSEEFDTICNDCNGIDDCTGSCYNCFEILFPMSFVSSDGTITTVNDEFEMMDFFTLLDDTSDIMITYPIYVELEDGTQQSINNDTEFETLLDDCYN